MIELLLPLISFTIAFFSSLAGLSGAFLLIPFQVSVLGLVDPTVNATNFLYNVIAIPSGVYRYAKERRFLWILAISMISGVIPGIFVGSLIRTTVLLEAEKFKIFVGLVLLYLGIRTFYTVLRRDKINEKFKEFGVLKAELKMHKKGVGLTEFEFWGEIYKFSPIKVCLVALLIGIIGGIYGVGGGVLLTPIVVTLFRLPLYTIAGASLFGTFIASIAGVLNYTALGYPPNLRIGILLGIGGFFGVYNGARIQKYVPERIIRTILSLLILALAFRYLSVLV